MAQTDVSKIAHILGANFPPPPAGPPQAPAATAAVAQQAAQASHLASQLLTQDNPQAQARVGRSPAPKRKLPPRGGLEDYASTRPTSAPASRASTSSRCASRTPYRGIPRTSAVTADRGNSAGCTLTHPACDAQTRRGTALHALRSRGRRSSSCTACPLNGSLWGFSVVVVGRWHAYVAAKRTLLGLSSLGICSLRACFPAGCPPPLSQWSVGHLCLGCLSGTQSTFATLFHRGIFFLPKAFGGFSSVSREPARQPRRCDSFCLWPFLRPCSMLQCLITSSNPSALPALQPLYATSETALLLEPHRIHLIQLVALAGLLHGGLSWSLFMPFLVSYPRSPFTCLTSLGLTLLRLLPPQFLFSPPPRSVFEREVWRALGLQDVHPFCLKPVTEPDLADTREQRPIHPSRGIRIGEATNPGPSGPGRSSEEHTTSATTASQAEPPGPTAGQGDLAIQHRTPLRLDSKKILPHCPMRTRGCLESV